MPYNPAEIEPRWQSYWDENKTFKTTDDTSKPKYYILDMFPYPSGAGLHVGHPEGYTATDILARYKRMGGFNVLHPMGWDAFGLPAERAAVREGRHPADITKTNTDNFRRQIKRLGFSYDWDREVNTSDPQYYRWTQWIFLRLFEKGLAYQAEVPVNWCPALGTVLANEEVSPEGTYKETGDPVEKRLMKQWMLKITEYAERLLEDLDELDWPEPVKKMQREWIGRSEGARVTFEIQGSQKTFDVFTTRPDTLYGATYCVLAPEHPWVTEITTESQRADVESYVDKAGKKSERDRRMEVKDKTGVFTGAHAINPVNGETIPIWIADYVLSGYGTGAIMAVPAHDQRDFEFAKTFDLPIQPVVKPAEDELSSPLKQAFEGEGVAIHSDAYDGLTTAEFKKRIIEKLENEGRGAFQVQYALRDWLFSRQRYWGEPFPLVILEDGTVRPVRDDALPVELPYLTEFKPTDDGRPPLARAEDWLHTQDPESGKPAIRETNTMPQWAGSCWYYLRYIDPKNTSSPVAPEKEKYWMPVDLYIGGTEHAVLHLLYARFWHKVLYDIGVTSTKEPFQKLFNQGMILGRSFFDENKKYYQESEIEERDGEVFVKNTDVRLESRVEKMSKSLNNVVNPDDIMDEYGADAMRLYEMFMGPLEATKPWQTQGLEGMVRFLQRSWRLFFQGDDDTPTLTEETPDEESLKRLHQTIDKVTQDIEGLRFNTAIASLMEWVNSMTSANTRPREVLEDYCRLLAPLAPHFAEEVWHRLGHRTSISFESWPKADPALLIEDRVEVPVSVKGKVRARVVLPVDVSAEIAEKAALEEPSIQRFLDGKAPKKVIYVPGRMINIVI